MELKVDTYTKVVLTLILVVFIALLLRSGSSQVLPSVAQAIEGGVMRIEDGEYFVSGPDPFLYRRTGEKLICLGNIRTRIPGEFDRYKWIVYAESK